MENVADSSQSRVKMVNDTVECDSSAYSEARFPDSLAADFRSCSPTI